MKHLRHLVLSGIVLTFLCIVPITESAKQLNILPSSLDNGRISALENVTIPSSPPPISVEAFLDKSFQDAADNYISKHWPARENTLLFNASLQRFWISRSAKLFARTTYPTYFGSSTSYNSIFDCLMARPTNLTNANPTATAIKTLTEELPEKRYFLFLAETEPYSVVNSEQGNAHQTYNTHHNAIRKYLGSQCTLLFDQAENALAFYSTHFRTDHHWNMDGAYNGYLQIAEAMELGEPVQKGSKIQSDLPMYGYYARSGLCKTNTADSIFDYEFDLPDYDVSLSSGTTGDATLLANPNTLDVSPVSNSSDFTDRYAAVFPSRNGSSRIENPDVDSGTLLIVGDSFARPIDRLLASHYKTTYLVDPRNQNDSSIREVIARCNPDDVLFITTPEMLIREDMRSFVSS